ncbi:MAG: MBL fold metallo-hydrolase [Candidatus Omnitrophica bacterium]|nr:MBL fold metallo-hydrolase [Candidatus Omnitrophota bacterium]
MKIKIIFDKGALNKKLCTGWGVSILINDKVLFDTGGNGECLLKNMRLLKVDTKKIEAFIISHDHWDHWGGLWHAIGGRKGVKVYICQGFSDEFKTRAEAFKVKLIELDGPVQIFKNIFITGGMPGTYGRMRLFEQAVLLRTKNGITIITGCAHPGIDTMLRTVKRYYPDESLYLALGGFHLKNTDAETIEEIIRKCRELGVKKVGPIHCSGEIAENAFKKHYGNNFLAAQAGWEIAV